MAAPLNIAAVAVMLVLVEPPVASSHRPSLPAVTVVLVRLMILLFPPTTRITGPAALARRLLVKFTNDPPPLSRATALAPAPVVVTVTLFARISLFGLSTFIPSAAVPEVLMMTLLSTSRWLADTMLMPKALSPVVVMVVKKGAANGLIDSWLPAPIMMAGAFTVSTVIGPGRTKRGSKVASALPPRLTAVEPGGCGLKSVEPTTVMLLLPVMGVVTRPGPNVVCDRAGSDASNSEVSTAGTKRRHHGGDAKLDCASQHLRCRPALVARRWMLPVWQPGRVLCTIIPLLAPQHMRRWTRGPQGSCRDDSIGRCRAGRMLMQLQAGGCVPQATVAGNRVKQQARESWLRNRCVIYIPRSDRIAVRRYRRLGSIAPVPAWLGSIHAACLSRRTSGATASSASIARVA